MYLKIFFENLGECILYITQKDFFEEIIKHLPIESEISVDRETISFKVDISYCGKHVVDRAFSGIVGFSEKSKEIILFFGESQPRNYISIIGRVLGPTHYLKWIENMSLITLGRYRDYGYLGKIAWELRNKGFLAGARDWEDSSSIVLIAYDVPLEIFRDKNLYIIETAPIFLYDETLSTKMFIKEIREITSFSRVDINKDNFVILSMLSDKENLPINIWRLSIEFKRVTRLLTF